MVGIYREGRDRIGGTRKRKLKIWKNKKSGRRQINQKKDMKYRMMQKYQRKKSLLYIFVYIIIIIFFRTTKL